jgi:hypothetical protein
MAFHLEFLETPGCTDEKLEIFGRAHYSYINQIFGDETVREFIQKTIGKHLKGLLVITPGARSGSHHIFKLDGRKKEEVCSYNLGYQDEKIDINDTLCQSYSLMTYFRIPFDQTPARLSTDDQKRSRQMEMIKMYRWFLSNPKFVERFLAEFVFEGYKRDKKRNGNWGDDVWVDRIHHKNKFLIIEKYLATPEKIIENIHRVLNIWEAYGWMYFIGDGTCK